MEERKYTQKEMVGIMDKVGFPKGLPVSKSFIVLKWALLNRKKLNRFCFNIDRGMYILYAFEEAKNNNQ